MTGRVVTFTAGLAVACVFGEFLHAETVLPNIMLAQVESDKGGAAYEIALSKVAAQLASRLEAAGQKSVTVLDFTDLQGQGTELGRFLAQELAGQLIEAAKSLSLVDRVHREFLLKENNEVVQGLVDPQTSQKLGNLLGVDTVVTGTVTPIENSVRLSVRAVALGTGKIVAAQSITMPSAGSLGQMYTHGLSTTATQPNTEQRKPDVRGRFRADSLKVSGRGVFVGGAWYTGGATLMVQNLSGIPIEAAIKTGSTSINGCSGPETGSAGLGLIGQSTGSVLVPQGQFTYVPANGTVIVKIELIGCQGAAFRNVKTVDVGTTLLVRVDGQTLTLPVTATDVPIQLGDFL